MQFKVKTLVLQYHRFVRVAVTREEGLFSNPATNGGYLKFSNHLCADY